MTAVYCTLVHLGDQSTLFQTGGKSRSTVLTCARQCYCVNRSLHLSGLPSRNGHMFWQCTAPCTQLLRLRCQQVPANMLWNMKSSYLSHNVIAAGWNILLLDALSLLNTGTRTFASALCHSSSLQHRINLKDKTCGCAEHL